MLQFENGKVEGRVVLGGGFVWCGVFFYRGVVAKALWKETVGALLLNFV